ncbi:MAG TPA: CinA family protein [Chloroflexia bacterium]|nr:CinA family protein [Chloroflexia bacterium]
MSNETYYLSERVGHMLRAERLTLAVAESCTGGLLGGLLTEVPGSSEYFLGGVIAYADEIKQHLLGVSPETLAAHGAVSAEVALEMARGVRSATGASLAVSITGVAGPGGGTPDKSVGLTYVGLVGPAVEQVERRVWQGDRPGNREASAELALRMVLTYLAERELTRAVTPGSGSEDIS